MSQLRLDPLTGRWVVISTDRAERPFAFMPRAMPVEADPSRPCEQCGAPSLRPNDKRTTEEEVRDQDLEPYVTLRYIARLFKVLAVLMIVMLVGEVVTGLVTNGVAALMTLLGEATRFLVLAGLMWSGEIGRAHV